MLCRPTVSAVEITGISYADFTVFEPIPKHSGLGHQLAQEPISKEQDDQSVIKDNVLAFLENLSGLSRGTIVWLSSDRLWVGLDNDGMLYVVKDSEVSIETAAIARLTWLGETYEIEALSDNDIWLNGRKVSAAQLLHGDMIEFGDDGPMSRFRLCKNNFPIRWPIEEILSDALAYAKSSRRPFVSRLAQTLYLSTRRIFLETSVLFRVAVLSALIALTATMVMQYRSDKLIQQSIQDEAQRIEALAIALAETRRQKLDASEIALLREQLDLQLSSNMKRLEILERRMDASARVISAATGSVAFLQGAYGLRQSESKKLLRHVLGPDGLPSKSAFGQPLVDVDGTGKPLEIQFTGTGFLLKDGKFLVTNRHIAEPWTINGRLQTFQQSGLTPEMLKLVAFFPGLQKPIEAKFHRTSREADLALLSLETSEIIERGITLSEVTPKIGDEVILMGYPTGLRALLAQAGRDFLTALEETGDTDFWIIAQRLSEQKRIAPLASRGIIAQITPKAVIYDAETTIGGSGGPALDRNGNVIAVNAAILPEFGGANIGVPVSELHRLLDDEVNN